MIVRLREQLRLKMLRRAAFERQGGLCHWCGKQMIWKDNNNAAAVWDNPRCCTADHVLQRSHGGVTQNSNIVAACRDCNNKRHGPEMLMKFSRRDE